jgi:hypothetical protein
MEMHTPGMSRVFFDQWFLAINSDNKLPRVHDKKLTIVTLCSLMEMNPSAIPNVLKEGWPGVVAGALKIFKDLPKAMAGSSRTMVLCLGLLLIGSPYRTQSTRRSFPR